MLTLASLDSAGKRQTGRQPMHRSGLTRWSSLTPGRS